MLIGPRVTKISPGSKLQVLGVDLILLHSLILVQCDVISPFLVDLSNKLQPTFTYLSFFDCYTGFKVLLAYLQVTKIS